MTNSEFQKELKNANTINDLAVLRRGSASKYVAACKEKISEIANKENYKIMTVSIQVLSNHTKRTNCNEFFSFDVPNSSRIFKGYNHIEGYVNGKIEAGAKVIILYR